MSESKARVCTNGTPTSPVVDQIMETIGDIEPGLIVGIELIETISGETRTSNRYKGVVGALKKRMFSENGVVLRAVPNKGYEVLDAHKRVDYASAQQHTGIKKIVWGGVVAASTDRALLTEQEKAAVDRATYIAGSLRLHELVKPKPLALP